MHTRYLRVIPKEWCFSLHQNVAIFQGESGTIFGPDQ